jgi:uncharacterized protein (UPF0335 family)
MEYFARYAEEVQPALDAEDPEEQADVGESTLNGNSLGLVREPSSGRNGDSLPQSTNPTHTYDSPRPESFTNIPDAPFEADPVPSGNGTPGTLSHPRPTSPSTSSSVERLEREAEQVSQTEHAIKQHISTDMKSLFRLARSAGIDREEFERIIKRELEVLPMLEQDD